jgi:putative metallohydrolase (TIGR04338 family)
MGLARDNQRAKVYRADNALDAHGGRERIDDLDDIQAWLMSLSRKAWYKRRWPQHARWVAFDGFDLRDGRGTRIARGGGRFLNLPRWARTKSTILHELAHCLNRGAEPHGWRFCHTLRLLARFVLGKEAEAALVASYKAEGVRYKMPRKRVYLSPERRAELAARMRSLHAGKRETLTGSTSPVLDVEAVGT